MKIILVNSFANIGSKGTIVPLENQTQIDFCVSQTLSVKHFTTIFRKFRISSLKREKRSHLRDFLEEFKRLVGQKQIKKGNLAAVISKAILRIFEN